AARIAGPVVEIEQRLLVRAPARDRFQSVQRHQVVVVQRGQRVIQAPCSTGQRQVGHPPPQLLRVRARGQREVALAGRPCPCEVEPVGARAPGQRAQLLQRAPGRGYEGVEALVWREPQRQRQLR